MICIKCKTDYPVEQFINSHGIITYDRCNKCRGNLLIFYSVMYGEEFDIIINDALQFFWDKAPEGFNLDAYIKHLISQRKSK